MSARWKPASVKTRFGENPLHPATEVWTIFWIISTFLILLQNGVMMLLIKQLEGKEPFRVLKFRTTKKAHLSQKSSMPIEKVKEDA
jgi:hypothetical protein